MLDVWDNDEDPNYRVSLAGLSFVVFAYQRGAKTQRLLQHLHRFATDYFVLIFDNGPSPIMSNLQPLAGQVVHYEYARNGFIEQHLRAASMVKSKYAMLIDDDAVPAVHGIATAINTLDNNLNVLSVHGSTAFFSEGTLIDKAFLLRQYAEDVSRLEPSARARLKHLYLGFYSRYWNSILRSEIFTRAIELVAASRARFSSPDVPEIVLETFVAVKGKTVDVGCITLWKDSELPTVITTLRPNAPSPFDFWRSRRHRRSRKLFFQWYAQAIELSSQEVADLQRYLRRYALSFSNSVFTIDFIAVTRRIKLELLRLTRFMSVSRNRQLANQRYQECQTQRELITLLSAIDWADLRKLDITIGGLSPFPDECAVGL